MRKSGFLTFCFAFVPGAGQMYQGYMKRGLSMILLFCLGLMFSAMISYVGLLLPVIWMYSFFDTFNLRYQQNAKDNFLIGDEWLANAVNTVRKKPTWIGGGLIVLGVWMIFDTFVSPLLYRLAEIAGISMFYYNTIYRNLPTLAIAVVIIYLGFRLAFGTSKKDDDDFQEFKGENADKH